MDKEYKKQIEQIKLDAEKFADKEMLTVYKGQKIALDKLHSLIGQLYIKYANDGLLKMTSSQKNSIGIDKILKDMTKGLATNEVEKVSSILSDIYKDSYYKQIYIMNSGLKVALKFDILKPATIKSAVNTKMVDEMFSDRIWANKVGLADTVKSSLVNAMLGNKTIDQVAREVSNRFNITAYDSSRLVNTESARILTQASHDEGVSIGVEQVMWSATLDGKTCVEDAELDGKIFPIDEAPDCPTHPNCRCAILNVAYPGWSPTQRRDNSTGQDISYTNYSDWKENQGIS